MVYRLLDSLRPGGGRSPCDWGRLPGSGSISEDGYGPVYKVFLILGAGFAWLATLALAGVGALCGLIGLVNPSTRTRSAWAATVLNAVLVAISFVLMMGPPAS